MPTSSTRKKTAAKKTAARRPSAAQEPITPPDPNSQFAPTTWGSIGGLHDVTCPSGQRAQVKRPGVEGLITAGVLHKIDSLTALVNKKHLKKAAPGAAPDIDMSSLMKDAKGMEDLMHTVDRVVVHCVVQPPLKMTPNDVTSRKPGIVYADMVDLMDKMFIFNYVVGGSADLDSFRLGLGDAVGGLDAGAGVGDETE